jgi:ATP-dependent RNA helicase DOB1
MVIAPVELTALDGISSVRIFLPKDLRNSDARQLALKSVNEIKRRFPDGMPILDPVKDMNIKDDTFKNLIKKIETMEKRLAENELVKRDDKELLKQRYEEYALKMAVINELKETRRQLKRATAIMQLDELKCRKRVLRR